MNAKFDLSGIEYSRKDKKKGITIPTQMSPELAEDIGIMIGDGSIFPQTKKSFKIRCSGDPIDEKHYYDTFVAPLKNSLFNANLEAKLIDNKRRNEYGIDFNSQAIASFYIKVIGLPVGKKEPIVDIPYFMKNSTDSILISCVRGIFDTDGSVTFQKRHKDVHYYPILRISSMSLALIKSLNSILMYFNFPFYFGSREIYDIRYDRTHIIHEINISGKKNFRKWIKLIDSSNLKHSTKFSIWEKFGFCPIKTHLTDRLSILEGKLDPNSLISGPGEI